MQERPFSLSEKTLIPISLAVMLVGLAFWTGTLYVMVVKNSEEIKEIKSNQVSERRLIMDKVASLQDQLGRIDGRLEILINIADYKNRKPGR